MTSSAKQVASESSRDDLPSPSISGEELREKIARALSDHDWLGTQPWDRKPECYRETYRARADAILALLPDTASQRIAELEAAKAVALKLMSDYARQLGELQGRYDAAHWPGIVEEWREKAEAAQSEAARWKAEAEGAREIIEALLDDWHAHGGSALSKARAFLSQHSEGEK